MRIELAQTAERAAIIDVYRAGWTADLSPRMLGLLGDNVSQIDFSARWPAELQTPDWRTYKVMDDFDQIVGVGVVQILYPDTPNACGHFRYFYLLPDFKGRGAGRRMLAQGTDWLLDNKITSMREGVVVATEHKLGWIDFLLRHGAVIDCALADKSAYQTLGKHAALRLLRIGVPDLRDFKSRLLRFAPELPSRGDEIRAMLPQQVGQGWDVLTAAMRQQNRGCRFI